METLQILEQRITQLITLVKKLQDENAQLTKRHSQVVQKLEALENSMLQDNYNREQTIHTVDELIKSIDNLVGKEQQP